MDDGCSALASGFDQWRTIQSIVAYLETEAMRATNAKECLFWISLAFSSNSAKLGSIIVKIRYL